MRPPPDDPARRSAPIRQLLVLDIERILTDLTDRRTFLLRRWRFHRDRKPFLVTAFSRWQTVRASQLAWVDPAVALQVDSFYATLEAFRRYIRSTEDMHEALEETYDEALERLREDGQRALRALGAPAAVG